MDAHKNDSATKDGLKNESLMRNYNDKAYGRIKIVFFLPEQRVVAVQYFSRLIRALLQKPLRKVKMSFLVPGVGNVYEYTLSVCFVFLCQNRSIQLVGVNCLLKINN